LLRGGLSGFDLKLRYGGQQERNCDVADTAATIIDFNAYRSRRWARRSHFRSQVGGVPHQFVATTAAVPLVWFWPVFVWVPIFVPAKVAAERDFS